MKGFNPSALNSTFLDLINLSWVSSISILPLILVIALSVVVTVLVDLVGCLVTNLLASPPPTPWKDRPWVTFVFVRVLPVLIVRNLSITLLFASVKFVVHWSDGGLSLIDPIHSIMLNGLTFSVLVANGCCKYSTSS